MSLQTPVATTGRTFTPTTHHDTYPSISPSNLSLTGLKVFITGASKGIGRATALSYAKAGASYIGLGARSELSDLETEIVSAAKEAGRQPPQVLSVKLDVQSRESVEAAAGTVKERFGNLDVLVNNAGYLEDWKPIAESDPDDWWKTWEINIKGPYLTTRSFLPLLLSAPESQKTILNIASAGAHVVFPSASAYQTTKLALLRLSEFINAEYQDQGVVAFSVHPGGVDTAMAKRMPKEMHARVIVDTPALSGDTLVWLTKEKREWLRGRYVNAQWDMDELLGMKDKIEKGDLLRVRLAVE